MLYFKHKDRFSPKQGDCDAGCRHGLLCRAVKADNSDSWQCDHLPQ